MTFEICGKCSNSNYRVLVMVKDFDLNAGSFRKRFYQYIDVKQSVKRKHLVTDIEPAGELVNRSKRAFHLV